MSVEETVKAIQANVKASGATAPAAIRAAVFDAFAGLSSPAPLNDSTLDKIADKLIIKQAHAPAATAPVRQFAGGTGIHNPALGTAEEHFPLPLSPVVYPSSRGLSPVVDHGQQTTETMRDHGKQTTAEMLEKVAILEQKLATSAAEMEAKDHEAESARLRIQANAQANLESEIEARNRATAAELDHERQRAAAELDHERQRAAEEATTAARELAASQALAAEKAERGMLTDEQIDLAIVVIRGAIVDGKIVGGVGITDTSPLLKAAGLPTTAKTQRVLHKLACKTLETEGVVAHNPEKGVGQPLYLVA
jgi:Skp family chaperone for outer membrane proteins